MPFRAALYLRRSTEEHQEESLETQRTNARRFVERHGWTLDPRHIFVDDAISRAEFQKRRGLTAMLLAVDAGEVDVVVVRDETRLGGDLHRTGLLMQDMHEAGVRLFYYASGEEVALDTATDRILAAIKNYASELEREKNSQRVYENLRLKAEAGLNAGGRVFGYDNVPIVATGSDGTVLVDRSGQPKRLRTEYRINEAQARLVREIAEAYAGGLGYRAIAKWLNERGLRPPRVGKRGTGSWSQSAVKTIIENSKYRGEIIWNKYEKGYKKGTKVRALRPEQEWIRVPAPSLRILDEELCARIDARGAKRKTFAGAAGRVGREPKYLLAGLARCGMCGGPIKVSGGKDGTKPIKVYGCGWHRDRGDAVCSNKLRRPVETTDEAVIAWIEEHVLREDLILDVLAEVRRRLAERAQTEDAELPRLTTQAKQLRAEIERFTESLLATDAKPDAVIKAITEREKRLVALDAQIALVRTAPSVLDMEVRRMEAEARRRLADLRGMLSRSLTEGRRALQAMLDGPLRFEPNAQRRYDIRGTLAAGGALFTTESVPSGTDMRFGVEARAGLLLCNAAELMPVGRKRRR